MKIETNDEYLSSVTLFVLGDELDPEKVSQMLSLEPSQAWRKGQQKSVVLPNGSEHVFDSHDEYGGWKRSVDSKYKDAFLETQLQYWIEMLQDKTDAITELKSQGMQCILDLFITTGGTATIDLSEEIQTSLASLGLAIEISIMTGPDVEDHDSSTS